MKFFWPPYWSLVVVNQACSAEVECQVQEKSAEVANALSTASVYVHCIMLGSLPSDMDLIVTYCKQSEVSRDVEMRNA